MPQSKCPGCASHQHVRWLPAASKDAYVDYYRCGDCGYVWHTPKHDAAGHQSAVTQSAVERME